MGMFDYVRCDYPITPDFVGECQTKEMSSWGGGGMDLYYIDPVGVVWRIDYFGTHDLVSTERIPWEWEATGEHGKVRPHDVTDYVTIYPSRHEGSWETWPEARLHIVQGKVQSYTLISKGTRNA